MKLDCCKSYMKLSQGVQTEFPVTSYEVVQNGLAIGIPVAIQASGIVGSVVGLVGMVSVYCDRVR